MAKRKNASAATLPDSTMVHNGHDSNSNSSPSSPILSSSSASSTTDLTSPTMSAFSASDLPSLAGKPLPTIQVNKHNLAELKQACDDAVRSVLNDLQFTQDHTHTDVKLVLGWIGVIVAAATTGWSYKYGFEATKDVVWVGVVSYMILVGIQMAYAHYVEGQKIYVGKRRSLSKRIETELINVSSHTLPSTTRPRSSPLYALKLSYRRTTNASKSLIRKSAESASLPFGDLVDDQGGIEEERVRDWVGKLVGGVVGDENGKGRTASGNWSNGGSGSSSPTIGGLKSWGTKEE